MGAVFLCRFLTYGMEVSRDTFFDSQADQNVSKSEVGLPSETRFTDENEKGPRCVRPLRALFDADR